MPIDASTSPGDSAIPTGSFGFSRNARIVRESESVSITPNSRELSIGTRIPAIVSPEPSAMCCSSIWRGSIRKTWSAPKTQM